MPANGVISPLAQKVNQCSERLTKLTKNLNTVIDTTEHHNKLEQLRESLNKLMEEKLALDEAGAVKKAVSGPILNRSIEATKKELQAVTAASPYNDKKINKLASEFKAHVKIQDEINSLLEEIEVDIKANNKSKVTNFFINDFLQ